MLTVRTEHMADFFTTFHLEGLPFDAIIHRFTAADVGDPYDHAWAFRSFILSGGYVEERYDVLNRKPTIVSRVAGASFFNEMYAVHRIVKLIGDECYTLILPDASKTRVPGFYQFRHDGVYRRPWNGEFVKFGDYYGF